MTPPNESSRSDPKASPLRLSCPVCKRTVLPLPGHTAVKALEGHLERDHWFPGKLAHDAACEVLNQGLH